MVMRLFSSKSHCVSTPCAVSAAAAACVCMVRCEFTRDLLRVLYLCQLEEELGQVARPDNQVAEVIPLMDGEDSPRRVLCPWRAHPPASTLPAVARATAGRFMRDEWLVATHPQAFIRFPNPLQSISLTQ